MPAVRAAEKEEAAAAVRAAVPEEADAAVRAVPEEADAAAEKAAVRAAEKAAAKAEKDREPPSQIFFRHFKKFQFEERRKTKCPVLTEWAPQAQAP
jgi:hypothetical protein